MVFVTLGTQDKEFKRLLLEVDDLINKGIIKDKVVVQKGCSKYQSNNMELNDYLNQDDFIKYINDADYIISHGGVGTIITCLDLGKKVIVVPRLKKYGEHHNDHQLEIVGEFSKDGYIIDGSNLSDAINKLDDFKPKKYKSNNDNFVKLITDYIDNN